MSRAPDRDGPPPRRAPHEAAPTPPQRAWVGGHLPGAPTRECVAAPHLSPRERAVLHQLAARHSTTRMAAALVLSTHTVQGHVRTLQRKLTAPDRDGIVGRARELGLL